MSKLKIIELTKDNEKEYIEQIVELEEKVLKAMEEAGKKGQLFITGKEDIIEYIESPNNSVIVGIDKNNKVQSTAYITQGQKPFTYNDITKYFKYGKKYQNYVQSLYKNKNEYKKDMIEIYKIKLEAYKYAKKKILNEHLEFNDIDEFLKHELNESGFDEKSILREELNKYMSEYIEKIDSNNLKLLYEQFYWITSKDIAQEFGKEIKEESKNAEIIECDNIINLQQKEYETILKHVKLEIHEQPQFDETQYYTANTTNTVEIDTYLTSPEQRQAGTARMLVYEGIKKHINNYFKNSKDNEIFLCCTLHRENLSSKYVSEFFGLEDNLFVKRRKGRDREVHICKVNRQNAKEYLENIQDKLIVLYGYNPENKKITEERKKEIIKNQIKYEKRQFQNLNKIRHTQRNYTKNTATMKNKAKKVVDLRNELYVDVQGGEER